MVDERYSALYEVGDEESSPEEYKKYYRGRTVILLIIILTLVAIFFIFPFFGSLKIPWTDVIRCIVTFDTDSQFGKVVWNVRIVRLIGGILAGAGLAVCGVVMQCILKNPLASPYTLGLSNAAAFGAAFSIVFVGTGSMATSFISIDNPFVTTLFAFGFSMMATAIILLLTKVTKVSAETMVLAGVAISAIFAALLSFTQYVATDSQLGNIVSWMFGNVGKATWSWDLMILGVLIPATGYFLIRRWDYNAMDAGDEAAKSLGVDTRRERIVGLMISSLLCSAIVSFFGIIAFVGLLGPHIARMIVGGDHRYLIPASMAIGALIIAVSDQVGMNILSPEVVPVGIITSMIGGPLFIYLLIKGYRK